MIIDQDKIRARLRLARIEEHSTCPPLPGLPSSPSLPAAVLIPLLNDGEVWNVLFIKRSHHHQDRHSGQIAFPGGRADQNDPSLQATALREAAEEIGLLPAAVQILGQSCQVTTVTGYTITPFVGILPWPFPLALSPAEVEKAFTIPLDWLVDPGNHRTELWQNPLQPGSNIPVIFFNSYQGETLWGATAQILVDFLELAQLLRGDPDPAQG